MAAVNLLPLSSLPHLLYNKQCNSFKLFPFKVGTMPSFPSRRCWKDTPEGRGFLESPAGARERVEKCGDKDVCWCLPLPMAPAASPVQPCGLGLALTCLQPPHVETRAPAQRPHMHVQCPLQPPAAPRSQRTGQGSHRGVHREPLHLPPTQPASSEGLVLTGAHPRLPSPVVECMLPACTPGRRLLFAPRHQTSSSLTQPANSSGIRWPNHSFASGV